MFFSRTKYFLVFGVLIYPDEVRHNFETAVSANRCFINQKVAKEHIREKLFVTNNIGKDTKIIFTNILRITKSEFNEWNKEYV